MNIIGSYLVLTCCNFAPIFFRDRLVMKLILVVLRFSTSGLARTSHSRRLYLSIFLSLHLSLFLYLFIYLSIVANKDLNFLVWRGHS
jgi:hypothetical protein